MGVQNGQDKVTVRGGVVEGWEFEGVGNGDVAGNFESIAYTKIHSS